MSLHKEKFTNLKKRRDSFLSPLATGDLTNTWKYVFIYNCIHLLLKFTTYSSHPHSIHSTYIQLCSKVTKSLNKPTSRWSRSGRGMSRHVCSLFDVGWISLVVWILNVSSDVAKSVPFKDYTEIHLLKRKTF